MSPKPGQACILGICWDKPNKWKPNYGGRADADTGTLEAETEVAEIDTGTLEAETDVAMWTPTYELKAWYCMKGSMGKQMQHKDSTCIGGTPRPVYGRRGDAGEYTGANDVVVAGEYTGDANLEVAMMTQDMVDSWRSTLERHYDYSAVDLDENYATQLAFRGRGSTCSLNPYGRRSSYCNDSEVEAPVRTELPLLLNSATVCLMTSLLILNSWWIVAQTHVWGANSTTGHSARSVDKPIGR